MTPTPNSGPNDNDRAHEAKNRLTELRGRGFRYIASQPDGDFWYGCHEGGLEIADALRCGFLGDVNLNN